MFTMAEKKSMKFQARTRQAQYAIFYISLPRIASNNL